MRKRKRKPGGGRKKGEPTKVIRVPVSLVSHIVGLIKTPKCKTSSESNTGNNS